MNQDILADSQLRWLYDIIHKKKLVYFNYKFKLKRCKNKILLHNCISTVPVSPVGASWYTYTKNSEGCYAYKYKQAMILLYSVWSVIKYMYMIKIHVICNWCLICRWGYGYTTGNYTDTWRSRVGGWVGDGEVMRWYGAWQGQRQQNKGTVQGLRDKTSLIVVRSNQP